jgi:hypothetical protein
MVNAKGQSQLSTLTGLESSLLYGLSYLLQPKSEMNFFDLPPVNATLKSDTSCS